MLSRALFRAGNFWIFLRSLSLERGGPPERIVTHAGAQFYVRRRSSDPFVLDEVFNRKTYGERPSGVVVDLGANIGAYTLYSSQTAEKVFAFEPERSNFTQLQKNIALNRPKNITVFKKAVGGAHGRIPLYNLRINKGASSTVVPHSSDIEQIEMVTLKEALEQCGIERVTILKIDIEGAEYDLIEKAPIETLRKIDSIVMETHYIEGKRVITIVRKLENAGFHVRVSRANFSLLGMKILYATRDTTR